MRTKRRQQVLGHFLILVIIATTGVASPLTLASMPTIGINQATLNQVLGHVGELRELVDRSDFDVEAVLDKLDYEPDAIVDYVKTRIVYQPYHGLLRGAAGTLQSSSGNSLDQSVLLATMLGDAGFDARIVSGRLSKDQRARLLNFFVQPVSQKFAFRDNDKADDLMQRIAKATGAEMRSVSTPLEMDTGNELLSRITSAVNKEAEALLHALASAKSENAKQAPDGTQELTYYWIQYRAAEAKWLDAHPALSSGDFDTKLTFEHAMSDQIPPRLQQRISIDLFIEQTVNGKAKHSRLGKTWERPVANMTGQPLVINFTPLNSLKDVSRAEDAYLTSDFFVPVLNGVPFGSNGFDLDGRLVPMDVMASMGAALFKTVSSKTEQATAALRELGSSSAGPKSDIAELSDLWAEITIAGPDLKPRKHRVSLWAASHYKCLQPESAQSCGTPDADRERRLALATQTSLAIATGSSAPSYIVDRVLERTIATKPIVELLSDPDRANNLAEWSDIDPKHTQWLSYLALFELFDLPQVGYWVYRAQPAAVVFQQHLNTTHHQTNSLNVLQNPKAIGSRSASVDERRHLVFQGVWDTVMEHLFVGNDVDEALKQALPLTNNIEGVAGVKLIENMAQVDKLNLTGDQDWHLRTAISQGYAVVLPEYVQAPGLASNTWYRVNSSTGESLGMTTDGRGGALEYIGKLMIGIFVVAPIYVLGCVALGGDLAYCVMGPGRVVAVMGVGGFALITSVFSAVFFFDEGEAY